MLLYGMTYVTHEAVWLGGLHAYLQALLGHAHQLLLLGSGLAHDEHAGGIGIIAVENGGEVYIDYIALAQHILFLGNAVAHHLVDAGAHTHGEALVVQTSGNGMMLIAVLATYLVYLQGRHADMYLPCNLIEHASVHHTCLAYSFNLFWCLNQITCWDQLALVFPIHNFFIHLCWLLSRQTVPTAFLTSLHSKL